VIRLNTITLFQAEYRKNWHIIELDEYKINEAKALGKSTMISPKFYNKGVYRVLNSKMFLLIALQLALIKLLGHL